MPSEWYARVPKELLANVAYRREVLGESRRSASFRRLCMKIAGEDVLWWINTFCWLQEPRGPRYGGCSLPMVIPFITRAHQDKAILAWMRGLRGGRDVKIRKSRGEGASYLAATLAQYYLFYRPHSTVGMCSATEDKCDVYMDPANSLLGKIDWHLTMLPEWMTGVENVDWRRNQQRHTFRHYRTGAIIKGFAATEGTGRGGRFSWFFLDEHAEWKSPKDAEVLASLQHATRSRVLAATPFGSSGAYYNEIHRLDDAIRIDLAWWDNPSRNRGLYRFEDGVPVAVDPTNNPLPPDYITMSDAVRERFDRLRQRGFMLTNKLRSPYYDAECDRAESPQFVARELDMDFGGSRERPLQEEFFQKADESVCPPLVTGDVDFLPGTETFGFRERRDGPAKLWLRLVKNAPPEGVYVLGADISSGTAGAYTSNSVASVIDVTKNEQVFEYATNTIEPGDFAELCVLLCMWFRNAYLIWETTGNVGAMFRNRLFEGTYRNIFYQRRGVGSGRKKTMQPGYETRPNTKGVLFTTVHDRVLRKGFKIRSNDCVRELGEYVVDANGAIESVHTGRSGDHKNTHGDRAIALMLALVAMRDRPAMAIQEAKQQIHANSPMGRYQHDQEEKRRAAAQVCDGRTNWEIMHGRGSSDSLSPEWRELIATYGRN